MGERERDREREREREKEREGQYAPVHVILPPSEAG